MWFARSLVVLVLLLASAPAFAERERMTAEAAYDLGIRYLKRGYYVKALEQLQRVRTYYRDDPYALKAELAIADLHFRKNEWDSARLAYESFMRAHPRYRELDYVVWRYGITLSKKAPDVAARDQTWTRQAVATWAGFGTRFPESTHRAEVEHDLQRARNRLARKELLIARFYDRRHAHAAVVGRAEGLLRDYPASPDRPEAMALAGIAHAGLGNRPEAESLLAALQSQGGASPLLLRRLHAAIRAAVPAEPVPAEPVPAEPAPAP